MKTEEATYALQPSAFHSMQEAQDLTDALEEDLQQHGLGAPNVRPELVEILSELVNNAAEHGMSDAGAHTHVRLMPHRKGLAFDVVVSDQGPGIRATLSRNPKLAVPETDQNAIALATQELVSGTSVPTRGIGLWMTVTEMQKPGRKLWIQSASGLLTMYGDAEPELRQTTFRQGVTVRLTIPA